MTTKLGRVVGAFDALSAALFAAIGTARQLEPDDEDGGSVDVSLPLYLDDDDATDPYAEREPAIGGGLQEDNAPSAHHRLPIRAQRNAIFAAFGELRAALAEAAPVLSGPTLRISACVWGNQEDYHVHFCIAGVAPRAVSQAPAAEQGEALANLVDSIRHLAPPQHAFVFESDHPPYAAANAAEAAWLHAAIAGNVYDNPAHLAAAAKHALRVPRPEEVGRDAAALFAARA